MNTRGGTVGGGEILDYWRQNSTSGPSNLDTSLIRQFMLLPFVKVLIVMMLAVAVVLIILKLMQIRNPFRGKAVTRELNHLDKVKKRDASIVRTNRMIQFFTNIFEQSPLALNKSYKEYWEYNLSRANIRIPGGYRVMRPEEFKAIISAAEVAGVALGILTALLISIPLGSLTIIATIFIGTAVPMRVVRSTVRAKDNEIVLNFSDFYLMIHYTLLASANTPIAGIMKSYDKTTNSDEMHRFIDVCVHYIDTYGEYEATRYIAKQYREVNEVGKLMRLIRQANEGGDVRAELMGFRQELLDAKRFVIEKRMNKLVAKAKMSFNILTPILIQAVISAMAIYLDDLSIAGSLF